MNKFWLSVFCFGCTNSSGTVAPDAVAAIVDPSRTTHFFDLPFPSPPDLLPTNPKQILLCLVLTNFWVLLRKLMLNRNLI